jgi:hypothetical protein
MRPSKRTHGHLHGSVTSRPARRPRPLRFDQKGLPVGLQLIGDKFREDVILSAALAFERETAGAFIRTADMGVTL